MKITLASINVRTSAGHVAKLVHEYMERSLQYAACDMKLSPSESSFLQSLDKQQARTPSHLILLEPKGRLLSSESFATHLGHVRDTGTQRAILAIGPADGWSSAAIARADLLLSLGPMTFPHELARVIVAEQIYRALTILAGHPYHTGH